MKKLITTFTLILSSVFLLSSCGEQKAENNQNAPESPKKLSILYPSWVEGVAISHLAKVALEDKGYEVQLTRLEPGPIYASLAKGDADIFLDAWLPYTHKDYWEKYGENLEIVGSVFDDAMTGLVVPEYVPINSIEELNANKDKFSGKIYGIGAGAGIHGNTLRAIDEYGLNFEQVSSSEASMMGALKKATSANEWAIITGWKPHYMWSQYKLKTLADPKNIYQTEKIQIVSRKGFAAEQPYLAEFFKNFALEEAALYELINAVSENERDPDEGARKFYESHKEMVDGWSLSAL